MIMTCFCYVLINVNWNKKTKPIKSEVPFYSYHQLVC